jgi:hypothetical protein
VGVERRVWNQSGGEPENSRLVLRRRDLSENLLVDDNQDKQNEYGDDGASYETLLVHPKIQGNLG